MAIDISLYYYKFEDLTFPFLFLGIFLALFQLPVNARTGNGVIVRRWEMMRKIASELTIVWFILALILGAYITIKVVMTAVGWVAIKIGRPVIFGQEVWNIDDKLGIGCDVNPVKLEEIRPRIRYSFLPA